MNRFPIYSLLLLLTGVAYAGSLASIVALPNQGMANVMVRDSAGNLYLAGQEALVTKLSSDGAKIVFQTKISPNVQDTVTAMALAPDGSILIAGATSGDFPVTPDAAEPQPSSSPTPTGFFARLNPSGKVTYASYLNAAQGTNIVSALATDSSGAAYVTGEGVFNSTPGALPSQATSTGVGYYIVKLDQTGKQVWATGGIGGSSIAVDAHESIYIAGSTEAIFPLPVTSGAFQLATKSNVCEQAGFADIGCFYQYVAKLEPLATKLIYCTWLAGSYGAFPTSLTIDNQGNAILTGTTQSFDYPVTPAAFQTVDFASQPLSPTTTGPSLQNSGPPVTGYVTKLNATGTELIFSTYLGGSFEDTVDVASLDSEGNIYLAGQAGSPDFPGVSGVPDGCRPTFIYAAPYITRLSADGSSLTATEIPYGLVNFQGFGLQRVLALFDGQGNATVALNGFLASMSLFGQTQRFACAVDTADVAPLTQIAPGQLLTLLGDNIAEFGAVALQPQNGFFPVSNGDSTVKIHGIPAPILYTSSGQINVQVPYEIAGQTSVTLEIDDRNGNVAGSRKFGVVASQPSAFTSGASYAACKDTITASFLPVALNADGSMNSCANPAVLNSTVTFFINGLGTASAGLKTGAIAVSPAKALKLPVSVSGDAQFVSAESVPGSSNSIWALKVTVNNSPGQVGPIVPAAFTLIIGGVPVRDPLIVWVKTQ